MCGTGAFRDSSIESLMMVTSSEIRNTCTFVLEKGKGDCSV